MSQTSYEAFVQTFPSDGLLCAMFGVENFDQLFEQYYEIVSQLLVNGGALSVFPSDAAISNAIESGVLTVCKKQGDWELFELNKEAYRRSCDLCRKMRMKFHSVLIASAVTTMRRQKDAPGWNGTPRRVYIFKEGAYGDVVLAGGKDSLPVGESLRRKLCSELIAALVAHPLYTDIWWDYVIKDDSVWLQPKELTANLKADMQRIYDAERDKHGVVTYNFYPGWTPDKRNDPPSEETAICIE